LIPQKSSICEWQLWPSNIGGVNLRCADLSAAGLILIPHQLYLASEVSGRMVPRVLLADEVGLGKTIEACLILHRLLLTGRAQRVLILVPDSLVHQWFVELLRRFNLWFHIFDEERCDAIETANADANPFLDDQLVLASLSLFTGKERRIAQALAASWDLLVVDEAHHLGWTPESVSPEYALVEALGRQTPGLLLLTATPEQLGMASHFARLRLLDPDRFYDLNEFIREAESYRDVARLAEKLLGDRPLTDGDVTKLAQILADTEASVRSKLAQIGAGADAVRAELRDALLDQHGTGRVMFRNTRATIRGFPKRVARLCPLPTPLATGGCLTPWRKSLPLTRKLRAARPFPWIFPRTYGWVGSPNYCERLIRRRCCSFVARNERWRRLMRHCASA
jgi:ATP-dependent helicase HepA